MLIFKSRKLYLSAIVAAIISATLIPVSAVQAGEIGWHQDLRQSTREAARQQKPMFVMVGADWCGYCQKMLNETLSNPQLVSRISDWFVPVKLDADRQSAIVQKLNVRAYPTILVISSSNQVLARIEGFQSAAQLETQLAVFKRPVVPAPGKLAQTSLLKAHSLSAR